MERNYYITVESKEAYNRFHLSKPSLYNDLRSEVMNSISKFYYWSFEELQGLYTYFKNWNDSCDSSVLKYIDKIALDSISWYKDEGKTMFSNFSFSVSMNPFPIQKSEYDQFVESMESLKRRWKYQLETIEELSDFEDVLNWILELPYMIKKRIEAFNLVVSYRSSMNQEDVKGYFENYNKVYTTETSSDRTCLFYKIFIQEGNDEHGERIVQSIDTSSRIRQYLYPEFK
ncbi:hypothetical protein H5P36_19055 [Bacillus sp. APMAM]|nr:hypothetical protein [Bacillus sp. APMAM]RTZ54378.1 hypothetical protein EKO25_18520 [Bacillus sp. SAJ1]